MLEPHYEVTLWLVDAKKAGKSLGVHGSSVLTVKRFLKKALVLHDFVIRGFFMTLTEEKYPEKVI